MLGGIKAHAKAGRFETKPFPLFKDLQTLFAGKVATGQFAIQGQRRGISRIEPQSTILVTIHSVSS